MTSWRPGRPRPSGSSAVSHTTIFPWEAIVGFALLPGLPCGSWTVGAM
jgi:V8-like Glu-specific endopeptidase